MIELILYWLIVINLVATIVCIFDKLQAKKGGLRVSENTLFALSVVGGSVGMYITMQLIRHKTRHKRFMIGLPVIILFQCAVLLWLLHISA